MIPTSPDHLRARRRFIARITIGFAVLFVGALVAEQLRANGVHGLTNGPFIGLTLGVGIITLRYGRFLAFVIERLTRAWRQIN